MTMSEYKLKHSRVKSPVAYESVPQISDDTLSAVVEMEAICDRIAKSDDISVRDLDLYDQYRTKVQYEMRKGRFVIFRRLYDLVNLMIDQLQNKIEMGEDITITPSQMRLYMTMFLDQTRAEFEDKGPDTVVDQRKQTVNIIRIVGEDSIDVEDNGRDG